MTNILDGPAQAQTHYGHRVISMRLARTIPRCICAQTEVSFLLFNRCGFEPTPLRRSSSTDSPPIQRIHAPLLWPWARPHVRSICVVRYQLTFEVACDVLS